MHYLKAMERLDRTNPTYKALHRSKKGDETAGKVAEGMSQDSLLDQHTLKALDDAAATAAQQMYSTENANEEKEITIPEPPSLLDEDNLEAFFSDEDESGISTVENLHGVMKRVSKKAAMMIEGINQCQTRMDNNFRVIKQYLTEGRKPNLEFKRQILPLSDEFVKIANLKFTRENAEQVYAQAEDEWQKQLQQIAENKKIKLEDRATKMKMKNDTEQIIAKAMKSYDKKPSADGA